MKRKFSGFCIVLYNMYLRVRCILYTENEIVQKKTKLALISESMTYANSIEFG